VAADLDKALTVLERELAEGHGKATPKAAADVRAVLKAQGRFLSAEQEARAHAALSQAGELEGWQRWRADQLREELVAKAEGLLKRPEGQAIGGRKMQETLRALREQWKQTDQGGIPNHGLWKRFDEACNEAYKVVEAWLEKIKTEAAEHKAQRLALIEEIRAWAAENATARDGDWKGFNRILHQFGDRWRDAGHLSEKAFAEMQPLWKDAINAAAAPLVAMQKRSLEARQAMIEEATALGAAPVLRIDAVKSLQQRWQAEAQTVPLDRKHEQKLWDAFRKPIDEAFNRKTQDREKAASALSDRDRIVLDASKALTAANASGDAQKIRAAMATLEAALRGQAQAAAAVAEATAAEAESRQISAAADARPQDEAAPPAAGAESAQALAQATEANPQTEALPEGASQTEAPSEPVAEATPAVEEAPAPAAPPRPVPKPVIAMRGDDRPGMKKTEPVQRGKFGDRKDGPRGARPGDNKFEPRRDDRAPRFEARDDRGPRLGDVAFRAQRDALESAQMALKKLAAQAHGEALSQLMSAWEQRAPDQVPGVQELGRAVSASVRAGWTQALGAAPAGDAAEALLRLEIASEAPTPAEHIAARRMLQLQLLTKRNAATPVETWGQDAARVLASPFEAQAARRLQNALKTLLRR
ncbi:MAG: DUF349 domain-containing protein, partial [Burkholderiaceae bacterium]|nr:DUF349 domain-containing protein [Burkholderiaceae bacterium]